MHSATADRKRTAMTLISREAEKSLRAALATNDLRRICSAIDIAVHQIGVERVAQNADVDRTTVYRAFRLQSGPALETMVRVLLVLDLALTVEVRSSQAPNQFSRRVPLVQSGKTARFLTAAFRSRDLDRVVRAFAEILSSQENISEFTRQTIRSREALYRAFTPPRRPRFSTLLSVLNALGLQFSVERPPSKSKSVAV
jgi:probable addiction module antidote protein